MNVLEAMTSIQKPAQKGVYVARIELVIQRYNQNLKQRYDIQT